MADLVPFALKDAPALIESVFPAQKVSFESQRERKANLGQTLTSLGSYWKGRKPLILVRAIVLGSLLPATDNPQKDLEIFEALMAFDLAGLARRAVSQKIIKPKEIAAAIRLDKPWQYFTYKLKRSELSAGDFSHRSFPIDADVEGIDIKWRSEITDDGKALIFQKYLATLGSYEERSLLGKRPEEVDQAWLYQSIWKKVNAHLSSFGVNASSHQELVEQLGMLRFGHRPKVGDTFAGGGSIPFEAARLGCDAYASDLNPIACMLTWGAFNIIGANVKKYDQIKKLQEDVAKSFNEKILNLAIETDEYGNRAKAYLYCLEVRCPETGWLVPLSPSWVISRNKKVIAKLTPNHEQKSFDISVVSGQSDDELVTADQGTIQGGDLVYQLDGKIYRTSLKTIRGESKKGGVSQNTLRRWEKDDFKPKADDVFQERLYAIHWIRAETVDLSRQDTYFTGVTPDDLEREKTVEKILFENCNSWQHKGYIPDMAIESGYNTDQPIRERGWKYWHQLFTPRHLLLNAIFAEVVSESAEPAYFSILLGRILNVESKMSRWSPAIGHDLALDVFYNMALNTFYNYGCRASISAFRDLFEDPIVKKHDIRTNCEIVNCTAESVRHRADYWITDPPYADAVHYHEITEYFIAWLRKNPPAPFDQWTWDSRRALAIKGSGDDFRKGMIDAYTAMAKHMPDNGMQCVMFTHQDTGVWSDMVGIFWAAGLQVVAAWYIATETSSELKKGGYVQGTVTLMLRKRPEGENVGFKQRIMPLVRREVESQIKQMLHLNNEVKGSMGEPVFNDSDLQMAGYAAALKVLTAYTQIGGEDVTTFAMRPKVKGEVTVVDEIVEQAAEVANGLLVPEGLSRETWQKSAPVERFYLRMLDIESTGASKLDNYQNFAKAFRVQDYSKVMASMKANDARLKSVKEFASRDLSDTTEIGLSPLGQIIIALQQLVREVDPKSVVEQLQHDIGEDFLDMRERLADITQFLERKLNDKSVVDAAEVLHGRLINLRIGA
jgi:adenine-specific DNA methylase